MSDDTDTLTLSVDAITLLLDKARQAGWETGAGLITDEYARTYLRSLAREVTGVRIDL